MQCLPSTRILVAAGVATSVQEFMMVQQKKWLSVLCQRRWANGMFLVAQFTEESNEKSWGCCRRCLSLKASRFNPKCRQALGCQRAKGRLTRLKICFRSNGRTSVSRFPRLKKE